MYRHFISCLVLFSLAIVLQGQKSEGGKPYVNNIVSLKTTASLPSVNLKALDLQKLLAENAGSPEPYRYGIYTDTLIDIKKSGKIDIIPSLGRIWRLRISSPNAKSLQITFAKFILPTGAKMFLYNDNQELTAGAFTKNNERRDSGFVVADFKGNHVIIEYFEPDYAAFDGQLVVGSIGQAFNDTPVSESGPSFININCPIGKDAQLAKHAVCKMSFRTGIYLATCSGALISDAKHDSIPYFLTANHCISAADEAESLILAFNYELAGCGGDPLPSPTLTGSQLLTTYQQSDFTLLLLDERPTSEYQPFYAGWDANDHAANDVTGIHVPYGELKKISIDYDTISKNPVVITWDDDSKSPIGSHWVVGFDEGKTASGSSGSPLFNSNNQIIGQLHGGDDVTAFYGRLSYSYGHKPQGFLSMRHYLDPDSTGIKDIEGFVPTGNVPDAFFVTRSEKFCYNTPITFNDFSVFEPYDLSWSASPSDFTFENGTTDTSKNPQIAFHSDTVYVVTLDLKVNGVVKSTETLDVTAGKTLDIAVESNNGDLLCDCKFKNIKLKASGADNYIWAVRGDDTDKISLTKEDGDTTTVLRNSEFISSSDYIIDMIVIGTQASCADTLNLSYNVLKPENDEIANAVLLNYGRSDYYSNICASVEEGEPIPPYTSCTAQDSWCDEYNTGENIVENSVWFKFVGASGRLSISSTGFDNQIALYDADSYNDILGGNYDILAANDDRSETDFRPLIKGADVTSGKTYWIQVDGSGGGLEDDFYLTLTALATSSSNLVSEGMNVYPQPATDMVFISNASWEQPTADILIYNTSGACIFNKALAIDGNKVGLDISSWSSGIYLAMIRTGDLQYIAKIVKK